MKLIDMMMADIAGRLELSEGSLPHQAVREILDRHLMPVDAVTDTEPLICYFATAADREEFIAAVREAMPGMRTVKL